MNIDQVKSALQILYDVKNTTPLQRKEANKWLEQFQKTVRNNLNYVYNISYSGLHSMA